LISVSCPTTEFCIAAGENGSGGVLIATSSAGAHWHIIDARNILALDCVTPFNCYGIGSAHEEPSFFHSIDGGHTWVSTPLVGDDYAGQFVPEGLSCPTSNTCFVVTSEWSEAEGFSEQAMVQETTTAGAAFTEDETTPPASQRMLAPYRITCPTALFCMTGVVGPGGGSVATTLDGGSTWSLDPLPSGGDDVLGVACVARTQNCTVAVASSNPGSELEAVSTLNGGSTWGTSAIGAAAESSLLHGGISCPVVAGCVVAGFTSPLATIAAQQSGGAWTDGQVTQGVASVGALACPISTTCVGVGDGIAGWSSDGGLHWSASSSPAVGLADLKAVACATKVTCIAAGL
jgi:hypothetical protein